MRSDPIVVEAALRAKRQHIHGPGYTGMGHRLESRLRGRYTGRLGYPAEGAHAQIIADGGLNPFSKGGWIVVAWVGRVSLLAMDCAATEYRQLRRGRSVWVSSWFARVLLVPFAATPALALPPNFLEQTVADNWNQAVGLSFASDGRMFVWEKGGLVWNVENGVRNALPLIDISEEVGDWRDYGLLGFAIDPNFYANGYIYLLYVVDYHHLVNFGAGFYDPQANEFYRDTIARLTRYTCNIGDGFRSVDYGSRLVLIGESMGSGLPICHQSHGIGTVLFGEDGTLLLSCGDAASYESVDTGTPTSGSSNTCLSDGIITPKEDVGAFRAQLVDSLDGKILRLDAATGNGVPSNPFYSAAAPRSARSRVWALGVRNPFRMTVRPGTGNSDASAGDPGTLYVGDVGWYTWEDLQVCKNGAVNFGWPMFEGLTPMGGYFFTDVPNLDAPNPLFGTTPPGQGLCTQEYFFFRDLIIQDTLDPSPSFPNPCDPSQQIPATVDRFVHTRPAVDWGHGGPARTGIYVGDDAAEIDVGTPGSPVEGPQFAGNSSTGGVWYTGSDFPPDYYDTYFHAEFGAQWIRNFVFDGNDNPVEIRNFAIEGTGSVVALATDPVNGGLYYIAYDAAGCCNVRYITWVNNVPPIAVADATPDYGPAPLTVQFTGSNSTDPDGLSSDLNYTWDFGDGTPLHREADPIHIYPTEDITADGEFVGMIFSLSPPHPIGGGNPNHEVMRDGDYPPVGNQDSWRQYDTYHGGQQGNLDWIGYTFSEPREMRALVFQEGKHFFDGGWFDVHAVQARVGGVWQSVARLVTTPLYPGNNDISYETFVFRFDPVTADGIRIYGEPGGSADFFSVGELRVLAAPLTPLTTPTRYDVTLTVTDALGGIANAALSVHVNNTPPSITITSPVDGSTICSEKPIMVPLTADMSDAEHATEDLSCRWRTILHHNQHIHPEPSDYACSTQTVMSGVGHENGIYYFETELTVTDPLGLASSASSFVFPDCEGCLIDADCNDGNPCTDDTCLSTVCVFTPVDDGISCDDGDFCTVSDVCTDATCSGPRRRYGDVNLDGVIDLDDILCTLDAFAFWPACPGADLMPCAGNGVIDLDDVLAQLDAFGGEFACPPPCP